MVTKVGCEIGIAFPVPATVEKITRGMFGMNSLKKPVSRTMID